MPDPADKKQSGRFQKGQSGNPSGRPAGSRNQTTLMLEKVMADDAEDIVKAVVSAAKGGDLTAARLVLDRLVPARRGRPAIIELPEVATPRDIVTVLDVVLRATAAGDLTPDEGMSFAELCQAKIKAIETADLAERLSILEQAFGGRT